MPNSFSLDRMHCSRISGPDLRREIFAHTRNDTETDSIVRSLERFGQDPSIRSFEVTPIATRRSYRGAAVIAWSVRAERA